ncbi:MAG TPA: hypothetical protein VKM55_30390 [Candidatus Lokiarchaeia archaeon]|nr:hypothetical protein [Candidatus Lokiarchaeia archaeon]
MSSVNRNPVLKKKFSEAFNAPMPELEHRAYFNLVEDEMRQVEADIFKILNKHGIKDAMELDAWFQEGRIAETEGWEDFFTLDGLEHKRKMLQEILQELS